MRVHDDDRARSAARKALLAKEKEATRAPRVTGVTRCRLFDG